MGALALAAAALGGCAAPPAMTISEAFSNPGVRATPVATQGAAAVAQSRCALVVDVVKDQRSDPTMLGSVANRPVRAPANADAWMRNVVAALQSRGIDVSFNATPDRQANVLVASLSLRTAWVSEISTSKTATTLWSMRLKRGDKEVKAADYRGVDTAMNWASGDGELQRMVDRAMGSALDSMAVDVKAACAAN